MERRSIASTTPTCKGRSNKFVQVLQQTRSDVCAVKMNCTVQSFDMFPRCKGQGTVGTSYVHEIVFLRAK